MTEAPSLVSICIGMPEEIPGDPPWTSAIYKTPVTGPSVFSRLGIMGDAVADRTNHGGGDNAVLAYSFDHYEVWKTEFGPLKFGAGGFGENLAISGLSEETVCIGDRWQIGDVVLEVSQPRQPCWKLNRKWDMPELSKRVIQTGRSGWYLRVIQEGKATAGETFELQSRPHQDWPIKRISEIFYSKEPDTDAIRALRGIELLAEDWRSALPVV
ncbi:MAG: MOSC domain-containing protein [bacterium]|nr:MOSC domain-containing protein [bacterium]